ncbi:MAG: hypothetical protein KatS3mg089_0837 [Patescibacteria group bacterium]|nr:MAG: hypothetical protein KatS3mg089_0837 [Patescibacteria group bacterium]
MDQQSGSNPLQELASQTEINPRELNVPHKLHHFLTKKVIIFGIAFLIIIILSLTGTYYALQMEQIKNIRKVPPSTSTPTPTTDPTANWKTYQNSEYEFSFNYPSNLVVQEEKKEEYNIINLSSAYKPPFSDHVSIRLLVYPDVETGLKVWIDKYVIQELPSGKRGSIVSGEISSYKNGIINGYSFIGGKKSMDKYIVFKEKNDIYVVVLTGADTGSSYKDNKKAESLLDQILSTFKFFDSSPTPTCIPRPACLDATPPCLIPETKEMCPKSTPTPSASFPSFGDDQVVCAMDAKQCPDGSFVGRTGPNCEFAACPGN